MSEKVRHTAKHQALPSFADKERSEELFKVSLEQEPREVNQKIMPDSVPDLSISTEKLCFIIAKARQFDAKDVVTDPDDSSNPADDAMLSVLEDHRDDPVVQEIAAVIFAMSEDEQIDLVTLVWLGRGDGTVEDWPELRAEAARAHNKRTASYLLGMPLLANHLEDALSQLGISCDE